MYLQQFIWMQPPRVFFRGIETIYLWCCVTTVPTAADSVSRLAKLRMSMLVENKQANLS